MTWWLYDLVIIFSLLGGACGFICVMTSRTRRHFGSISRGFLLFGIATAWLTLFYGSFLEPRLLVVRPFSVVLSGAPSQKVTAAVVADLHLGPYKGERWMRQVVERINALHPDLVFLDGDFVFDDPAAASEFAPLKELRAPLGVFAVTGNHDYQWGRDAEIVRALETFGVTVLRNQSRRLETKDGSSFVLAGIDDLWYGAELRKALEGVVLEETVLLLSHNPDVVSFPRARFVDFVISGHTHGGQIRLPWIGSLAHMPTALGNAFDKGLFSFNGQSLFITSGAGEMGPRARLFDPPEIAFLDIHF
ncbi:MAG TPA: metallophosphoesterase [Patescibacteria group bacterium]|nr:metallophosphoesterase [Patescibacteria group bacterium]